MPVSHYFNSFSPSMINEKRLLEDLIVESIQIMGHDVYYIPRDSYNGIDEIWGETINAKFTRAYMMEMYLANVEGYEGEGDFFSKFGLDIRDTTNIIVSYRSFHRYMPSTIAARPREGDLLYVPTMRKLFEIKFVEEELLFFSLGHRNPYIYELRCEVFRYNNENIETGVEDIDIIEADNAYSMALKLSTGSGTYYTNEIVYQGANLESATAKAEVKAFDLGTKTIEIFNIIGKFEEGSGVRGVTSNTYYTISTADEMDERTYYDNSDNKVIQSNAEVIIVTTEQNPFGVP